MAAPSLGGLSVSSQALRRFGAGNALSRAQKIGFIFVAAAALVAGARLGLSAQSVRSEAIVGALALDSAFTLFAFLCGVVVFRGWERVFPSSLPTLYTMYPLRGVAIALRELQLALRDGLMVAVLGVCWMLPLAITAGWSHAIYAMVYAALAGIISGALSFAVPVLYASATLRPGPVGLQDGAAKLVVNAAPAVTFGVTLVVLLFLKLGIGEYARLLGEGILQVDPNAPPWPVADVDPVPLGLDTSPPPSKAGGVIPRSVLVGIGVPVLGTLALTGLGFLTRARRWLRDMVRVAHAMVLVPELSYAWIDASKTATEGPLNVVALVARRDATRVHRQAPFRLLTTAALSALAALLAVFAAPSTGWVAIVLAAAWILLWLRLPEVVRRADTEALRHWDILLITREQLVKARQLTLLRVLAPYAALLVLPSLLAAIVHQDALAGGFSCCLLIALVAHAALRRTRS